MKLLVDSVGLVRTLEDPAQVYLIGLVAKILQSARDDSAVDKQFLPFLENRLKSGSAMVKLEAAKCLVDLAVLDETSETTGKLRDFISLKTVVQTLNSLLSHPKTPAKFAAIRKISQLAQHRPSCVMPIVSDIEGLLNDSNRTVGTLALFTLLKTSQESNLERLLKHIQTVITEVSDPFKADIVAVVHELAVQYPAKQRLILNFLSAHLREESSTKVKTAIAESLMRLSEDIPACRSLAVAALSEFIEDCESAILCARIVSYLGRLAPQLENPGQVVRFIYNRLILENAVVRVSAVSALANVADECPSLREDLLVLLETTLREFVLPFPVDVDDEVRSVSRIYLQTCSRHDSDETSTTVSIADALETDVGCSVDKLAAHLNLLYEQGDLDALGIINLEDLPTPQTEPTPAEDAASQLTAAVLHLPVGEVEESLGVVSLLDELNLDQVLPGGVSALGRLLSTGPPVDVTEAESEYRVQVFKHFFENRSYLLLEFQVTNTLEDQLLRNITADVTVQRTPTDSIAVVGAVPAVRDCGFDSAVSCFALLRLSEGPLVEVSLRCSLTYTVIEPNDEFEDDFPVNPFRLNVTDFIASTPFRPGVFRSAWKEAENYPEETLKLSFGQQFSSLQEAVTNLIHTVQLAPCDLSDIVDPTAAMTSVSLAGCVVGTDEKVLLKAVVGSTDSHGIVMKLAIRCGVPEVRAAFCKLLEA
ncbi:MAG: hypothetical protein KVP17_001301 [Porospora cf. gigantea B]|uniref:uncharacterized protein n=1 Tax=Porospora cf. gigantea B TaxID=2853592 RepID=UPI003571CAAA|nr:MAG: hypothetical protein KVP17_001301 [Porospora cf. gigantea B]